MNYLPFALLAYLLNSIAVTVDKFLLTKIVPNPLVYVFYISLLSLLVLFGLPFTHIPTLGIFILASAYTICWTIGAYFMFSGLKVGQISRVIPVIGTITPLILLFYAGKTGTISINETWGAVILILALIFITAQSWLGKINKKEIIFELLASLFFAVSYIFLKAAYLQTDFLTVLVWGKLILIPFILLVIPMKIKLHTRKLKLSPLFFLGQIAGGTSQLLLTFSIFLASPALVNSLQGTQYVFILILSLIFFKEKTDRLFWIIKVLGILLICLGLFVLALQNTKIKPDFGLTYSPRYARQLDLEPGMTFINILDSLKVKKVRLPVYWDEVEVFPGTFNFSAVDYYLNLAEQKGVKVILVLGYKQPRWPECFTPIWVSDLTKEAKEARILELVAKEVEHFKIYPNIEAWQVENEPLFTFGKCDKRLDKISLLKKEVAIVRNLDPRPILITDSGELSSWLGSINHSDLFGASLYKQVWNKYLGSLDYPLPPFFYTVKDKLVRAIAGKGGQTIISELQAEPWMTKGQPINASNLPEQIKLFPASKLAQNIDYAKETGFSEIYLWGIEWWYFMANHGHPEYLQYAKTLF